MDVASTGHIIIIPLLQWIATIGGIAATGTPYHQKFLLLLRTLFAREKYRDFEDFKTTTLEKILWISTTCDDAAQDFWDGVEHLTTANEAVNNIP